MSIREFVGKVIERRSLPPMWMWRPTWIRRGAMFVTVPVQFGLYFFVYLPLYLLFSAASEAKDDLESSGEYFRSTWRGEHSDF